MWQAVSADGRPELVVEGGLVLSLGGWTAAKALRGKGDRGKGDERVLGDGDSVQDVLAGCRQQLERRYRLTIKGCDFVWLVGHVSKLFDLDPDLVARPGRPPGTAEARSMLCCRAARGFGTSTIELSRRLGIAQPTASQSVKRGGRIVQERKLELPGDLSQ